MQYPDERCVRAYVAACAADIPLSQLEAYVAHYERRESLQAIADARGEARSAPKQRLQRLRRQARKWAMSVRGATYINPSSDDGRSPCAEAA